jgi:hypothetical protein
MAQPLKMLSSDHSLEPLRLFRFPVVGATRRRFGFAAAYAKEMSS